MITKYIKKIIILFIGAVIILALILHVINNKGNITILTSAKVKNQYEILVDVEESKLYLLNNKKVQKIYSCSGGKWNTPSPLGTWEITEKATWGEGFGGHWMGLNVPWGKFGIHGTLDPYSVGWASSHGCIRMNNNDVAELYNIVPCGTKVVIINGPYGNFGTGFRNLKSGMYGQDVLQIQKKLKELGYFYGNPNGKFGTKTEEAVQNYCKANNIYVRKTISPQLQIKMGFVLID